MEPSTGYAMLGDDRLAYQVIGEGPIDIVYTFGFWSSFDIEWEEPSVRSFLQQMASYARIIRFDALGAGASDQIPLDALPPWESFAEQIESVMDAVGSERAVIVAAGPGVPGALLFAASRPERTAALILMQAAARVLVADDYPDGLPLAQLAERLSQAEGEWGTGDTVDLVIPSRAGDPRLRAWYAKLERAISSPKAISKYQESAATLDARALLPAVTAPTLVILTPEATFGVPAAFSRYIAEHIDGAELVETPGGDLFPYFEHPRDTLDAIEEFLSDIGPGVAPSERRLAAVLFTDIVDSTGTAEALGDRRWRTVLELHDTVATDVVERHDGQLIRSTGDGVLAAFDGPGRAMHAATELRQALGEADLHIRSGIHTGEVELRRDGIDGIAVHLAARIMAAADSDEILVSNTVKDLVIGSDIEFEDRGVQTLKGFDGHWQLYAIST